MGKKHKHTQSKPKFEKSKKKKNVKTNKTQTKPKLEKKQFDGDLPSGKRLQFAMENHFFMGKSTISTGQFSMANC